MAIHVALRHQTQYRYDRAVALSPHIIRLRPAPHCRTRVLSYSLKLSPAKHFINWQQDPHGNYLARVVFQEKSRALTIDVDLVARVSFENLPVDDPVRWKLRDPRRLRATTMADWLWVRLVDVPRALEARRYRVEDRLVVEVTDTFLPENEGRYTLEVSSPGVERPLRTPEHFRRFVGTSVAVKTRPDVEGDRRLEGTLEAADDEGVVVAGRRLAYDDIEKARTVFVWEPAERGKAKQRAKAH